MIVNKSVYMVAVTAIALGMPAGSRADLPTAEGTGYVTCMIGGYAHASSFDVEDMLACGINGNGYVVSQSQHQCLVDSWIIRTGSDRYSHPCEGGGDGTYYTFPDAGTYTPPPSPPGTIVPFVPPTDPGSPGTPTVGITPAQPPVAVPVPPTVPTPTPTPVPPTVFPDDGAAGDPTVGDAAFGTCMAFHNEPEVTGQPVWHVWFVPAIGGVANMHAVGLLSGYASFAAAWNAIPTIPECQGADPQDGMLPATASGPWLSSAGKQGKTSSGVTSSVKTRQR